MYRIIFTAFFLIASLNIAQSVKVIKNEKLISGDVERLYFPRFSPDGNYILLTKDNFKGLWLYNISENQLTKLNDYYGSGFNSSISSESGKINFHKDDFADKRRESVQKFFDTNLNYEIEDTLININQADVFTENSQIVITQNGLRKKIKPLGDGNYIWVSLSPKNDKILFTLAGKGTYISDLNGRIITELGYANAPKWSPDGKWIVYMDDKDDGFNYVSSDIIVVSADGELKFNITDTNSEIEMYPEWSREGNKIVYHNLSGEIFLAELEFQK